MTRIDPLEQLPVGSALLVREQIDPPALWEMVWLVREETARIGRLGQNPAMEFRAGLFLEEVGRVLVAVVPVLVRVGPEQQESVYETWVNEHAPGYGDTLETLAGQARLVVHLYGDGCRLARSLTISNRLATFTQQARDRLRSLPPWKMQDFDMARQQLERKYSTVWKLWQGLAGLHSV